MIENTFLTGIVIALCQLIKQYVDTRWIPLIALLLGVIGAFGFGIGAGDLHPVDAVFEGIISGLVAVGIYSTAKNTIKTSP